LAVGYVGGEGAGVAVVPAEEGDGAAALVVGTIEGGSGAGAEVPGLGGGGAGALADGADAQGDHQGGTELGGAVDVVAIDDGGGGDGVPASRR
jgi:hypothetical protein